MGREVVSVRQIQSAIVVVCVCKLGRQCVQ